MDRRLLSQHRLPAHQERDLERKVAHDVRRGAQFGAMTGPVVIDMPTVRRRKRAMVDAQIAAHLQNYKASGAELIMGSGRFVAPKTLEVCLNDGGTRVLTGEGFPQHRNARYHSESSRPRSGAAAHPCGGSGARLCAGASDRARRRLRRP